MKQRCFLNKPMNLKPLLKLFSILVMFFSTSFIFPIITSLIYKDGAMSVFVITFLIVFIVGFIGWLISRSAVEDMSHKDGFLVTMYTHTQSTSQCQKDSAQVHLWVVISIHTKSITAQLKTSVLMETCSRLVRQVILVESMVVFWVCLQLSIKSLM